MVTNGYKQREQQLEGLRGKPVELLDDYGEHCGVVVISGNGKPAYYFVCRSAPFAGGRTRLLAAQLEPSSLEVDCEDGKGTVLLEGKLGLAPYVGNEKQVRKDLDRLRI